MILKMEHKIEFPQVVWDGKVWILWNDLCYFTFARTLTLSSQCRPLLSYPAVTPNFSHASAPELHGGEFMICLKLQNTNLLKFDSYRS